MIDKKAASTPQDAQRLTTEVEILKKVKHPNIVCLKDMYETNEKLCLIMELVTGGELFDKIVEKGQYSEKDASTVVKKMLLAVEYLHSINIAHRDLKPENLLLRGDGSDTDVMLSDFGLSKIIGVESMMETACGTPYYVAPEVLSATGYDKEVDLWSVGVITYLLLCGFPPFYGESLPEVFEQIMKAEYDFPDPYWTDITKEAKDFIGKLLVVDAKKRLSATTALKHPWIVNGGPDNKLNLKTERSVQYSSQRKLLSKAKLEKK
jgi:calcium/calmodulin-dependent protein kinase I